MLRPFKTAAPLAFCCVVLCVGRAGAGAQLGAPELVQQATVGVAVVDNDLAGGAVVVEWLTTAASAQPSSQPPAALPATLPTTSCVPTRAILQRWVESHPQHPGRATWVAVLAEGHTRQLVFVGASEAGPRAVCEAEVLLGRSFAQHPEHAALRQEIVGLLAARTTTQTPTQTTQTTQTTPTTPTTKAPLSTVEQGVIRKTPPPPAVGCW